jgi:hypothetical protein
MLIQIFFSTVVRAQFALGDLPAELEEQICSSKQQLWIATEDSVLSWEEEHLAQHSLMVGRDCFSVVCTSVTKQGIGQLWIREIERQEG